LFEGLKFSLVVLGIIYESLVFGFLPARLGVFLKLKVPKPLNFTDLDLDLDLIRDKKDSNMPEASPIESDEFFFK
jgi:hypothetical protein